MSCLEANLAVVRRVNPALATRMARVNQPDRAEWTTARTGVATARRGGVWLSSTFDPVVEASRAVPNWGPEVDVVVAPALGTAFLLEATVLRYPDLPMLLVEASLDWFVEVCRHRDLSSLWEHPSLVLLVGSDAAVLGAFLEDFSCRTVEWLTWRPCVTLDPEWHASLGPVVASAQARSGVNLATYRRFHDLWFRNWSRNAEAVSQVSAVQSLEGQGRGRPAVIAAAGPSLADSLDWLVHVQGRCLLLAVDTAWPALAARGLKPDVLLVMDGQYWNARHVDSSPPDHTLVVTEMVGPPRAFRLAPGRTLVAASSLPFLRPLEEALWGPLGLLPSGGSVATAAWSLALLLGCTEVAFAGLDLGYPKGVTHVAGSQFEETIHRRSRRCEPAETLGVGLRGHEGLRWVPSLDGGLVASDHRMDLFRRWLSEAVANRPEVRAVNLGTRGSVVAGLTPPPPDLGVSWSSLEGLVPGPALDTRGGRSVPAPFDRLRLAMARLNKGDAATEFRRVAEEFWGPAAWQSWAGRVWRTWERWPSSRSWRAVVEVMDLTLGWEKFWKKAEEISKTNSRIRDEGR